jgi:hypothetical protein
MRRYSSIPLLRVNQDNQGKPGIQYRKTVMYPTISPSENDTYLITTAGDRYDVLAQKYYNDASLWWVIACSNDTLEKNSLYPPVGVQLRVPANIGEILTRYRQINNLR